MNFNGIALDWTGHSGFRIKYNGKVVFIDPFQLSESGSSEKADLILITHCHYDHCSLEDIRKIVKPETSIVLPPCCQSKIARLDKVDMQLMQAGDEIIVKDIKIRAMPAYNIGKQFHQKSDEFLGYIANIGEMSIYHAGDTDLIPEMEKLSGFRNLIALLPVSGNVAMSPEEAAKAASVIRPAVAIPMHYGNIMASIREAEMFKMLAERQGIKVEILEKV